MYGRKEEEIRIRQIIKKEIKHDKFECIPLNLGGLHASGDNNEQQKLFV